jgi:hypothetical protein
MERFNGEIGSEIRAETGESDRGTRGEIGVESGDDIAGEPAGRIA